MRTRCSATYFTNLEKDKTQEVVSGIRYHHGFHTLKDKSEIMLARLLLCSKQLFKRMHILSDEMVIPVLMDGKDVICLNPRESLSKQKERKEIIHIKANNGTSFRLLNHSANSKLFIQDGQGGVSCRLILEYAKRPFSTDYYVLFAPQKSKGGMKPSRNIYAMSRETFSKFYKVERLTAG